MKTMQTKKQLIGLLLILTSLNTWADDLLDHSKKKEINQSFNVALSDQLSVDNRYGSITVTHWEKNEVAIRVVVESKSTSDARAQQGLDRVQIELKRNGNTVQTLTTLKDRWGGDNNTASLTIDYYINMPPKLAASISQKYGNINLPPTNEGQCTLTVAYGNIQAGSFTQPLTIDAKYSNVNIENVTNLNMDISYCANVTMGNAQSLTVDSKYSKFKLGHADTLRVNTKYGNLTTETVKTLDLDMKYGEAKVDNVTHELNITSLDYSSMTVRKLDADFKSVNVDARYGDLKLSIPAQAAFRLDAENMKYGKLNIKGLKTTTTNVDNTNKTDHHYQINEGGSSHIHFDGNGYSNLKINAL